MTQQNYHLILSLCRCARKDASNATLHQMKRLSNWYHENDEPEMAASLADIVNQKPANENEPKIERSKSPFGASSIVYIIQRRNAWQSFMDWLRG